MKDYEFIAKSFERLNGIAKTGASPKVVLFGSTFSAGIPFAELMNDYISGTTGYNRSIRELKINEAEKVIEECVFQLEPEKVFICLGDADLDNGDAEKMSDLISGYERLLHMINSRLPEAKIYLLSVVSESKNSGGFNRLLEKLAKDSGCKYVGISGIAETQNAEINVFEHIRSLFRTRPITFYDAMNSASV